MRGFIPRHGSEDNQIGLLLVVSYDSVLHVTVKAYKYIQMRHVNVFETT